MRDPNEAWQVDVNGQIYDTTFGELPGWIADNALTESDKVRRGELRWLEAGKVPALVPFFNAKEAGVEMPVVNVTTTVSEAIFQDSAEQTGGVTDEVGAEAGPLSSGPEVYGTWSNDSGQEPAAPSVPDGNVETENSVEPPPTEFCSIHPDVPTKYICSACLHPFCKECPESFGSSVRLCPYCGAMCKEQAEVNESAELNQRIQADIAKGFGFDDFGSAIAYPFRFKSGLLVGGLMFAVLGIGQAAASMGSIFLVAAALICFMLANAITFGVLANTINNFSQGIVDKSFMPSFDDFSLWEDVVHPFFLGIAVYVSSFGLLIALVVGMVWYTWSSLAGAMAPAGDPAMEMLAEDGGNTPQHIKEIIEKAREQNQMLGVTEVGADGLTDAQRASLDEEAEFMRLNEMAENYQGQQLEAVIGPSPEKQDARVQAAIWQFVQAAGVFLLLGGLALLWGLFYFPAACAVAGYTRSFMATINPLVGLDTIRHLGFDYVKILVMMLLLSIASGVVGAILGVVFMPFDLPAFGNLPAKFFGSFATFYFSAVFAVILGYALYKNSDKFGFCRR